jgi:hypothetical protein
LYHTAFNIFLEPPEKTIPFIEPSVKLEKRRL